MMVRELEKTILEFLDEKADDREINANLKLLLTNQVIVFVYLYESLKQNNP